MERVGLIQMTSGPNPSENLAYIRQQVTTLAEQGAKFIVTPENALVFGSRKDYHQYAEPIGDGDLQATLSEIAREHAVWLVIGSMPIQREQGVTTTSLLYSPEGKLVLNMTSCICLTLMSQTVINVIESQKPLRRDRAWFLILLHSPILV